MCVLCQANSLEHAIELIKIDIDEIGWAVVTEPGAQGRPAWVHTVGLEQSCGHPELLVVTCDVHKALEVLDAFAYEVYVEDALLPGDRISTDEFGEVEVVAVSEAQRNTPLLPVRTRYDSAIGWALPQCPPLQVLVPGLSCPSHPIDRWRLDRPYPLLAGNTQAPRHVRRRRARHDRGQS